MPVCLFSLSEKDRESTRLYYFEPRVIKKGKNECWEWNGNQKKPYVYFSRRFGKKKITWLAHRVAWMFRYNCPIPPELDCCHTCDNPGCLNPDHLFIGTAQMNIQDARRKGRLYRRRYVKPVK